jgi:type IV pilus assembly protein PilN
MAGLNLLPWREKEREAKKKQFFTLVGVAFVSAVGIVLGGHFFMQASMAQQQSRNEHLQNEITALDAQIKEIEELDKTRQSLIDRMKVIENLQSTRPAIVHLFDEMVRALPKGLCLSHLQQQATLVHLEGKAESYARVSSYMKQLDDSPWLSSSNLNVISTNGGGDAGSEQLVLRDFKLDVTQLLTQGGNEADKAATTTTPEAKK